MEHFIKFSDSIIVHGYHSNFRLNKSFCIATFEKVLIKVLHFKMCQKNVHGYISKSAENESLCMATVQIVLKMNLCALLPFKKCTKYNIVHGYISKSAQNELLGGG